MDDRRLRRWIVACAVLTATSSPSLGQVTREQVIAETMKPYAGPSREGVDARTMTGKVLSGYQGWFAAPGDGLGRGWIHWGGRRFGPGSCSIDLWPDMTEYGPDERFVTSFRHADGRAAAVFSSFNRKTVLRHFEWMKQYGLDGVFVQRFAVQTRHTTGLRHCTTVLAHCREGANLHGRTYAVMYDLTGLQNGQGQCVVDDWKLLVQRMQITKDPAYLHHGGRPVVAIWGIGFTDRRLGPAEGLDLVRKFKSDPSMGPCTVLLGVPTHWRTLRSDCVRDEVMHDVVRAGDIVSPWTVGRYTTPRQAEAYARTTARADLDWCRQNRKDFMPVVFPGFSWHNMNPRSPLDQIPRLKGKFLWSQYLAAREIGATMVYQAMFDEVDEGTAIFKCTNDPPVGESKFVTYEGLPSDFYLKLVGQAGRLIRGEKIGDATLFPQPPASATGQK
ncbi:MAG TPA: glycoside hydrolase family 71/99-like protein [Phycisphaerae bacterium]|nr:glycoside hydrolase family 71/99-like protein [Phycisphaerae bacterium]HQL75050.1 glycoside hydrolase family 71/99-like protein [Phycisphaerae bacterium]